MKVPFFDLAVQFKSLEDEIKSAWMRCSRVSNSSWDLRSRLWKKRLLNIAGHQYAIGVASGSDALLLSLMALRNRDGR